MKNETPDFGKKGPQYGNWIPYSLVMVSLAAALALLFPRLVIFFRGFVKPKNKEA